MLVLHVKQVRILLAILIGISGLSVGYFCAQMTGFFLQPPTAKMATKATVGTTTPRLARVDKATILEGNIFDPGARGKTVQTAASETVAPISTANISSLKLFGTVDGGENPLALIESGGKVTIYRIGQDIPGGGELLSVARNEIILRRNDGSQTKLTIIKPAVTSSSKPSSSARGSGISNLGNNRWSVSRSEVDKARSNLNQLLKSARMEPNIINGRTEGFTVKMIRPKSLLSLLGLRRGDTVTRVNGVELNSPEKALQIFQQLREAKRLTVDLKRGNENLTYDYEVN